MKLAILIVDGVFDTGLTVLLDVFSTANELAAAAGKAPPFDVEIVGIGRSVRTALGLTAAVEPADALRKPDWVIVPAINAKQPERLIAALERRDVVDAIGHIRAWHARGIHVAGACIGTFLLAEAGLLDHREATTSWPLAPLFRKRYPNVKLDDARMIVPAGNVVTAGTAMGHLDLALWLVRQASPDMAALVAGFMVIDRRPSQAKYIVPDFLAHADPLVERFERWAREQLAKGFSLQAAARALSVTPRTLQRRTEAVLGKSPLAFFQDLRVERAQHLMSLGLDLETIASDVGYADTATLRNMLRRRTGRTVRELRADLM
ncbi:GlxA family transcriptional regulator [Burkholderia sp. Ac-20379]|uniref:GlxA family transcriptional regulator n=1 Tax=Burkholderia sp. Ac-20379 TaxID=2703900 RepID=UPI00197E24EF|nr:helix-turn-helix domain-containing protein [Burkholderia sp. Ac-20379]MBN3725582.1 helix-turn-helix domain-containing protein [Burkholderia sp. Ac-20379]